MAQPLTRYKDKKITQYFDLIKGEITYEKNDGFGNGSSNDNGSAHRLRRQWQR